jgi:hypothetical protein
MPSEPGVRALDEAINTYCDTVDALICFGHILTWEDSLKAYRPGSMFALGRRLETSAANRIVPSTPVTPDLIAVITPTSGIVGEAKPSFHGTVQEREDDLDQLMKYDDDLTGWPTAGEKVEKSDVVLLVHYSRKGDTQDVLEAAASSGRFRTTRCFAVVSFCHVKQVDEYMSLEHFWGGFSDREIQKRLRPLLVPLEPVRPLNPAMMYDDPPPPPWLLHLAWDHVFTRLIPEEEFQSGRGAFQIKCSVQRARDMLAEACGPPRIDSRQPQIPRMEWVKQMFDLLVKMKLAVREKSSPDEYKVLYRKRKLPFFVEHCVKVMSMKTRPVGRPRGRRRVTKDHPELPL